MVLTLPVLTATFPVRLAWKHLLRRFIFRRPRPLDKLQLFLLVAPVLLFSMVAHEYAHGYAAMKQGDMTAQQLGRLTFNPLKHIDPFMTIILPVMLAFVGGPIFGGAKPIPVNPNNYRELRRGDIIVSLAGVATNFVIAVACVPFIVIFGIIGRTFPGLEEVLGIVQLMLIQGIFLNLILVLFNLIPLPPLDGSHVFKYLLPPKWALAYQRLGGIGLLLLFALLSFGGGLVSKWLAPAYYLSDIAAQIYSSFTLPNPFTA